MNFYQEPRFKKSEGESNDEFLHRIRVSGFWKFRDVFGNRWWPDHWGPRPSDSPTPIQPYKD